MQQIEEMRKKAQRDLESALKSVSEAEAARDRAERSKKKLQQEVHLFKILKINLLSKLI